MTKHIQQHMVNTLIYREKILYTLIFIVISMIMLYVFFLHGAIANVAKANHINNITRNTLVRVSELEATYYSLERSLTLETASNLGLVTPTSIAYYTLPDTLATAK